MAALLLGSATVAAWQQPGKSSDQPQRIPRQSPRRDSTVQGIVRDSAGQPLAGAQVKARNLVTNKSYQAGTQGDVFRSRFHTHGPALAISKGIDRDRAVDESGNQLAVFGRRGARPFNQQESSACTCATASSIRSATIPRVLLSRLRNRFRHAKCALFLTTTCPLLPGAFLYCYAQLMTDLLEEVLRKVATLPREEQDAIASQIIETLQDEAAWKEKLARAPEKLRPLADEAQREHRQGETRPLDELL